MYVTHPGVGRTFHIFGDDDRSLCGKYMMFIKCADQCDDVTDDTWWVDGQDCKACFRKARRLKRPEKS